MNYTPIETLRRKLNAMTTKYDECQKELRALRRELKAMKTSTNNSLNEFRQAVGSSINHKHKKRRLNRPNTPPDFWNLDF
jgi:hypothetical protein